MKWHVVILSCPNPTWPGGRNLFIKSTGQLLAISRNPMRDVAARLVEEGFSPACTFAVLDEAGDQSSTISIMKALALPSLAPDKLSVFEQHLAQLLDREKELDNREGVLDARKSAFETKLAKVMAVTA